MESLDLVDGIALKSRDIALMHLPGPYSVRRGGGFNCAALSTSSEDISR